MYALSRHAAIRANQRGITHQMIADFISNADVEVPAGGGCTLLRVSRKSLRDPVILDSLRSNPDKLANLAIVWCEESAEIVTLVIDRGGAGSWRYRCRQ
ncbi:MAG: hypothetical protein LCH78_15995 [Proteobacteria bacterium]|nr:hypothetical protein [Pseudomonadota bacterium]